VKLLLPDHLVETLRDRIFQIAPQCEIVPITAEGEIEGDLGDAEVFFLRWGIGRETFQRLVAQIPNLCWVHTISAGVDHVLLPELAASDAILTNASGIFNTPVAELVLAFMLAVAKRLPEFQQQQQAHRWHHLGLRALRGSTVGIVGMGEIGTEVARLCRAFGMRVLGLRKHPRPSEHADEILPPECLHDLLGRSDFVVIAAPLTEETQNLVGREELAAMKPEGWLINIGRGAIVDEPALIEALREHRIGGACLDVFSSEPLPEDSPLWDLPNVVITPHNAGSSPHVQEREEELFLDNLRRYVAGEPLLNVVDKEAGY
jgi:phosphoglycerate dehydrogenase-like enzyme